MIPIDALVRAWAGDRLVVETRAATVTALPEANGEILVPERDVTPGALEGAAVRRHAPGLLVLDPKQCRVEIDDRWPGRIDGAGTVNLFPRWGDVGDLLRLMDVQESEPGTYVAPIYEDRRRNVVEGSQLLGQAIVAASKAVPDQRSISAHMIFSRPARFDLPLVFKVTLPRRGRSFSTVSVEATQERKPVASALVLMDKGATDKISGQVAIPAVPGPEASSFHDFGMTGRDVRFVNGAYGRPPDYIGPPEIYGWVRHRDVPVEPHLRQALLAQFTGHMTIAAALLPHPDMGESQAHVTLSTGVLAITISFHADVCLSDWLLYANPAIYAGRGLVQGEGRVFGEDGNLAASYCVQAMVRDFGAQPEQFGMDQSRLM